MNEETKERLSMIAEIIYLREENLLLKLLITTKNRKESNNGE